MNSMKDKAEKKYKSGSIKLKMSETIIAIFRVRNFIANLTVLIDVVKHGIDRNCIAKI